jgi:hypothetical protein
MRVTPNRTLLFAVVMALGCSDAQTPGVRSLSHRSAAPTFVQPRTFDDEFAELATRVPGFGGFYYDDAGRITARLVDLNTVSSARAPLDQHLQAKRKFDRTGTPERRQATGNDIQFVRGDYDFGTLKGWFDALDARFWSLDGVVRSDIDEAANRLRFVVTDDTHFPTVRAIASSLEIPQEALIVERGVRGNLIQGNLADYRRNIPGAMRIRMRSGVDPDTSHYWNCSIGFNARLNDVSYFVTASHCSDTTFRADNGPYYQRAEWQPWEYVGDEAVDPVLLTGIPCGGGAACRFSEAILVRYSDALDRFGKLAAPLSFYNGTINIALEPTHLNIVDDAGNAYYNQVLRKNGSVGGSRTGNVESTCGSEAHSQIPGGSMRCQWRLGVRGEGGDSGGPIYDIGGIDPEVWDVYAAMLHGVMWLAVPEYVNDPGGNPVVYSDINYIRTELGSFTTY